MEQAPCGDACSVSYGKATAYLPVIDLLKGYFKIQDRDNHREIRERVIGKLLALDKTLEPVLPAFLALLDVLIKLSPLLKNSACARLSPGAISV